MMKKFSVCIIFCQFPITMVTLPQTGWIKQQKSFSHSSGGLKSKVKAQARPWSLCGARGEFFLLWKLPLVCGCISVPPHVAFSSWYVCVLSPLPLSYKHTWDCITWIIHSNLSISGSVICKVHLACKVTYFIYFGNQDIDIFRELLFCLAQRLPTGLSKFMSTPHPSVSQGLNPLYHQLKV